MEENLNQVVPSSSYDWLDQCGQDDDGGNNQVVPVTIPGHFHSCSVEPFPSPSDNEHVLSSTSTVADNDSLPSSRFENFSQKSVGILAVEDSLKALSLDSVQVVPSASRSPTMETLAMNRGLRSGTNTRKFYRSTSKTTI
ncbi:Molybdenum cofactor guanylyltransferase [Frankliniella fusca]|uniref:Molybdenum cofactor guanylyltransferase n=1 Tax=Frankliniella fusca TaxID=407009 RepID=A0AAE1LAA8_9NEOP|nr:Molybdenum cofactor guanylyltransferase [Frankliniella fusca]